MAVKLRLMRMGKKKQPTYRVVAADSRAPRDGRFIELIGRYDPRHEPSVVEIKNDRALHWLQVGAQPTPQVRKLLEISGAWAEFRVIKGEIRSVGEAPPPAPPIVEDHVQEVHVVDEEAQIEAAAVEADAARDAYEFEEETAADATTEPVAEPVEETAAEAVTEPAAEPVEETVIEAVTEPAAEPAEETVIEAAAEEAEAPADEAEASEDAESSEESEEDK